MSFESGEIKGWSSTATLECSWCGKQFPAEEAIEPYGLTFCSEECHENWSLEEADRADLRDME